MTLHLKDINWEMQDFPIGCSVKGRIKFETFDNKGQQVVIPEWHPGVVVKHISENVLVAAFDWDDVLDIEIAVHYRELNLMRGDKRSYLLYINVIPDNKYAFPCRLGDRYWLRREFNELKTYIDDWEGYVQLWAPKAHEGIVADLPCDEKYGDLIYTKQIILDSSLHGQQ